MLKIRRCFPSVYIRRVLRWGIFVHSTLRLVSLYNEKWCQIPEFEVVYWAAKSIAISTRQSNDLRADIESYAMLTAVHRTTLDRKAEVRFIAASSSYLNKPPYELSKGFPSNGKSLYRMYIYFTIFFTIFRQFIFWVLDNYVYKVIVKSSIS